MPRKPLVYTHEYPYPLTARSNNRECFYLSRSACWAIFTKLLQGISIRFKFEIHAFVLMDNHYHLIGTPSENHPLPVVMEWFQRSANRMINCKAKRINHLFGGPYRGSLIKNSTYYHHAIKYVFRNPIEAKIANDVSKYAYSSFVEPKIPVSWPVTGIAEYIPLGLSEQREWINKAYMGDVHRSIRMALRKSEFKLHYRVNKETKDYLFLRNRSQKGSAYLFTSDKASI